MSTEISLPPEAQQILAQLQTFQQQIQATLLQRDSLNLHKIEIQKALEALQKVEENENVYKIAGPVLIKTKKSEIEKELKEKLEEIEVKMKSLDKLIKKLEEKIKERQEKIRAFLEGSASFGGAQ